MTTAPRRSAGILLPAFSPRRPGDLGIGDTRALREWIDWAADHGVGFLQLLPIQETGADDSPYNAISSVALEPAYLSFDPQDVPWVTPEEVAAVRAEMGGAAEAPLVDYRAVRKAKRALLEKAWARFQEQEDWEEFGDFSAAEAGWLLPYANFRWLMEQNHGTETWDLWPEAFNDPKRALATLGTAFELDREAVTERLSFFKWIQWLCFRQWRAVRAHADARGVKLMGDIPIGVSWYSADVFFGQADFDLGWCGGAPPERVFKHDRFIRKWGQNWGIPLYRWDKMTDEDFPWWRQRVAKLTSIFHIFRIDHVLGFYRIYSFPWRPQRNAEFLDLTEEEAELKTGGLLPGWAPRPDDTPENQAANRADGDLRLRMVIEAAGAGEVVGEDLGCVPEYVRPHLSSIGIAGFRIPHWDFDEDGHVIPKEELPECSFATYATHDHDTLAGMWESLRHDVASPSSDPDYVATATGYLSRMAEFADLPCIGGVWPPYSDAIQWRLIKSLFSSTSRYAAIMITDLTAMTERFNRPGTVGGDNWRLRLPWHPSGALASPVLEAASAKLRQLIQLSGR
ncbi:4-alpha-glucanotransferase [Luteolibacter sp. LG18]|uniref:4-alpha-glucanotransferase n=1 Tax=Luteolibacter sp. LG18 TaxID=2819286 RepID=UPI002B2A6D96|nr:4-alpha-glucanotransferase [Luteolibacter sp. LG18]